MSGKYLAYPEYKKTGEEWLGDIPKGWLLSKHKYIAAFQKGKNPTVLLDEQLEGTVKYLSMDYLRGNSPALFAKPDNNTCVSQADQVLIIWDGSNAGEFVKGREGIVSSTMSVSELISDINSNYYWYLCVCLEPEMRRHANGMGIPHVNGDELKSSVIPLPEKIEQQKIANFLDHETSKIDTLIEKQQQLIKLLKEKRQAVISHAVTKGLNPDAPMRDSGVEWLGEVPEHWKVVALKHLVSAPIIDGPHLTPTRCDHGVPFISAEAISKGFVNFEKKWGFISEEDHEEYSKRYSPKRGDILMVKLGATTGVVALVETDRIFNVWVPLATIRIGKEIPSKFIFYLLQSSNVHDAIQLSWTFGTQQTLGLGTLENINLPVPPREECNKIVNLIESKVPLYEESVKKSEESLRLLEERRTALISAAVTGRIDVRDFNPDKVET